MIIALPPTTSTTRNRELPSRDSLTARLVRRASSSDPTWSWSSCSTNWSGEMPSRDPAWVIEEAFGSVKSNNHGLES
jgi:hypothetical protein